MSTGALPGGPGRASSHLPTNTVTVRATTAGAAATTGHRLRDQAAQSAAAVRSKAAVTGGLARVVIASATKCSGAGPPPRTATFRRRGDHDPRQPPSHGGLAPDRGGALGGLVTDPVAGRGGCSGRCCPDGDRVGRQVAARSTRAARQRPCGHSRRLPVGARGNGARVHGDPGRAGWARASAVQPGSYPRSDRMDDARGLELALAALPLALRCAGRGPAGSAAAMAALPLALVPRRATKPPVRGHRSGDRVPGVDCASTRPNSVALSHSYLAWSSQRTRYSRRTQKGERNFRTLDIVL